MFRNRDAVLGETSMTTKICRAGQGGSPAVREGDSPHQIAFAIGQPRSVCRQCSQTWFLTPVLRPNHFGGMATRRVSSLTAEAIRLGSARYQVRLDGQWTEVFDGKQR